MKIEDIQFRAYDIKEKKWLCDFPRFGGFHLIGEFVLFGQWDNVITPYIHLQNGKSLDDIVVTQYTGHKDKNSNDIFEGDIVEYSYFPNKTYKMEVVNIEGSLYLRSINKDLNMQFLSVMDKYCLIIGNIFDKNALLKALEETK